MATPGQKPSRLETSVLIKEIAKQTHLPDETVGLMLDTFISVVTAALVQEEKVIIRHFGTFLAKRVGNGGFAGVTVRFRSADELKKAVQEALKPMEKYGVETKTDAALMAQVTGKCPSCQSALETTKPPKCPNCGTEPFENKEPK